MSRRGGELIAANESTVVAEPSFDAIVMKDGQGDGCLSDSADTNESDGCEVFGQTDDLLDQLATTEAGSWRRGR